MAKGYLYILECSDGSYYTGSTIDLEKRFFQHQNGEGANHTKKYLPVKLLYFEEYERIDLAYYREKQIQGWSRKKKEALMTGKYKDLIPLSVAYRDKGPSSSLRHLVTSIPNEDSALTENSALTEALEVKQHENYNAD